MKGIEWGPAGESGSGRSGADGTVVGVGLGKRPGPCGPPFYAGRSGLAQLLP